MASANPIAAKRRHALTIIDLTIIDPSPLALRVMQTMLAQIKNPTTMSFAHKQNVCAFAAQSSVIVVHRDAGENACRI
jgi:hypothetical protein